MGRDFLPLQIAPAVIAVAVGLLVWRRHTADRRARLFLLLAISEIAFFAPVGLFLAGFYSMRISVAASTLPLMLPLMLILGGVSAVLFFHFGMAFPHARPWLRRGRIGVLYAIAVLVGAAPAVASITAPGSAAADRVLEAAVMIFGPLAIVGTVAACFAVYRSYKEMTADERRAYRAPIMGVLAGMALSLVVDVLLGASVDSDNRHIVLTGNLLATAAGLLFPLFFFTAATKYRLLERHSQDYVSAK